MRCRDAKEWLTAQRDTDLAQLKDPTFYEHLRQCAGCRVHERRQQRLDSLLRTPGTHLYSGISTDRIMRAVERQMRITQQLEDLRAQGQSRVARLRIFNPKFAAFAYLTIGLISFSLLALFVFQPTLMVKALALLSDGIAALVILAQYLQAGLALVTRDNWLLPGVALVLVVMMGMWLGLMRYPREA